MRRVCPLLLALMLALLGCAGGQQSSSSCRRYIPVDLWAVVWPERHSLAVVLYGVEGAASVVTAKRRLDRLGVCYTERLSPDLADHLIAYMRCEVWVFGGATRPESLDSFMWIGGEFVGDGYMLDPPAASEGGGGISDAVLLGLVVCGRVAHLPPQPFQ